jgi:acyl carrier protein
MPYTDETLTQVRALLSSVLQLGEKARTLDAASPLLGALPELDSMAVVHVLTAIEDQFGVVISDDEMSAEIFATLGSLAEFVEAKIAGQ